MSGGKIRTHKECKKSNKFDKTSPICKVCGYMVFHHDIMQQELQEQYEENEAKDEDDEK